MKTGNPLGCFSKFFHRLLLRLRCTSWMFVYWDWFDQFPRNPTSFFSGFFQGLFRGFPLLTERSFLNRLDISFRFSGFHSKDYFWNFLENSSLAILLRIPTADCCDSTRDFAFCFLLEQSCQYTFTYFSFNNFFIGFVQRLEETVLQGYLRDASGEFGLLFRDVL